MKHILLMILALTLAALSVACDSTAPANSRNNNKTEQELAAYFGKPGNGLPATGSGGDFTGLPKKDDGAGSGGGGYPIGSGNPGGATVAAPVQNDPTMDWADPCAQNLDEMVSALLIYYGQNHALPPSLEQVPRTSVTGQPISLSCPDSGKRYRYFPQGLRAPTEFTYQRADGSYQEGSRLVLCDLVAAHPVGQRGAEGGGAKRMVRLGIVMEVPQPTLTVPNPAVQMYIVPVDQGVLDMYLRANNIAQQ